MKKPQILFKCILSCLTLLLVSCGGGGDPLPERKSAAQLSSGERAEFVTALLRMKQIPSQFVPTLNAYDYFVDLHVDAFSGHTGAHMGVLRPDIGQGQHDTGTVGLVVREAALVELGQFLPGWLLRQ